MEMWVCVRWVNIGGVKSGIYSDYGPQGLWVVFLLFFFGCFIIASL